jgi:hypothetical protein
MQNMFRRNPRTAVCLTALLWCVGCAPPPITWNQAAAPRTAAAVTTKSRQAVTTDSGPLPIGSTQ